MGQDSTSDSGSDDRPESVSELLAGTELSEDEFLTIVSNSVTGDSEDAIPSISELATKTDEALARMSEIESHLDEEFERLRDDYQTDLEDVRERIIQVKREADAKAAADHDHPEVENAMDGMRTDLDEFRASIDEFEQDIRDVLATIESDHQSLTEQIDDVRDKLDRVANAVIELRRQSADLAEAIGERAAVAELAAAANRAGDRSAKCEACGETVDIGLLREPRCPHCNETFSRFEPRDWILGTSRLKTESIPALEGEVADEPEL